MRRGCNDFVRVILYSLPTISDAQVGAVKHGDVITAGIEGADADIEVPVESVDVVSAGK